MNNMEVLQAGDRRGQIASAIDFYICLYAGCGSPVTVRPAWVRSIPGIADQRLARPEQDHQQDPHYAHHGENRLVQHDLDDAVPEPGHVALHPGPEGLLAGLMDIVPKLVEPGKSQVLVGHPAGAVIDHEDESA